MTVTDTPTTEATEPEPPADPPPGSDAAAMPDGHAALAELAAGGGLDVHPGVAELRGLAAMAVTLAAAHALPATLQGKPNDVFLVLLTGRELGLAPAASLRSLYVVNGLVTLPPKVRKGLVTRRGLGRVWPHTHGCACGMDVAYNTTDIATWHATKTDEGHQQVYSFTFTRADAERAPESNRAGAGNLWDKYTKQGYPQRLMSWRALGYLLDDVFSEVGVGLYAPDEVGAYVDEEGSPVIDVASTDPFPGHAAPRGHAGSVPPPPPPPADPEAIADLRQRVDALPAEGKAALIALWTAPREGVEPMVPVDHLPQRQLPRARGMVSSIEARAKRGEWGPWPADADTGEVHPATPRPETPVEPPSDAAASRTPPEGGAPDPGPQGPAGCPRWEWCELQPGHEGECIDAIQQEPPVEPAPAPVVRPVDTTQALIDHLNAQEKPWLVAELAARHLGTQGNLAALRQRLGVRLVEEGWVPPQPGLV